MRAAASKSSRIVSYAFFKDWLVSSSFRFSSSSLRSRSITRSPAASRTSSSSSWIGFSM